jgi:ribosomal protein S18 acetylase RimI-like enzyme
VGIAVVARFRGQGLGTALLEALIEKARDDGWPALSLCTDRSHGLDQGLYARAGFNPVGSLDNAPDSVLMRLDLGTADER